LPVGLNKALNVSEDASHRGDVLTHNLTPMLCGFFVCAPPLLF